MATPNNHRVAAAFQGGKDPQQDAIIAWLGMLPKDTRGGINRSVMKYHMTRALLMYMQSGSDVSALVAGTSPAAPAVPASRPAPVAPARTEPAPTISSHPVATAAPDAPASVPPAVSAPAAFSSPAPIPTLSDGVKAKGVNHALRNKIKNSMKSA